MQTPGTRTNDAGAAPAAGSRSGSSATAYGEDDEGDSLCRVCGKAKSGFKNTSTFYVHQSRCAKKNKEEERERGKEKRRVVSAASRGLSILSLPLRGQLAATTKTTSSVTRSGRLHFQATGEEEGQKVHRVLPITPVSRGGEGCGLYDPPGLGPDEVVSGVNRDGYGHAMGSSESAAPPITGQEIRDTAGIMCHSTATQKSQYNRLPLMFTGYSRSRYRVPEPNGSSIEAQVARHGYKAYSKFASLVLEGEPEESYSRPSGPAST